MKHRDLTPSEVAHNPFGINRPKKCAFISMGGPQAHVNSSTPGELRQPSLSPLPQQLPSLDQFLNGTLEGSRYPVSPPPVRALVEIPHPAGSLPGHRTENQQKANNSLLHCQFPGGFRDETLTHLSEAERSLNA
jgi:hypothetical protein